MIQYKIHTAVGEGDKLEVAALAADAAMNAFVSGKNIVWVGTNVSICLGHQDRNDTRIDHFFYTITLTYQIHNIFGY